MEKIRKIINDYLDRYEKNMEDWKKEDPEGYNSYVHDLYDPENF